MGTFVLGRRPRLRAVVVVLSAVVVGGTWLVVGSANPAQATVTTLATFSTPGTYMWTVPTGVTKITFTVYGASGGNVTTTSPFRVLALGGTGGEAVGTIKVKPGETFEISVGGRGGDGINQTPGAGGSNGGGAGGGAPDAAGGGGGGASDVRIGGRGNSCASSTSCTVLDRIIVGGGGAGGGQNSDGGAGGGVSGGAGGSTGGGQEGPFCGGFDTDDVGCFGRGGGPFDVFASTVGDGGGGGGWFGGSGGSLSGSDYAGGGGGSGYISALALKGSFPGGTRSGDGQVIITTP